MPQNSPCPAVRYVEVYPYEENNHTYYYIRDPLEFAQTPLVITPLELFILDCLDGQNSITNIQEKFTQQYKSSIEAPPITAFVAKLDQHYYLDTEKFHNYTIAVMAEFKTASTRSAWHAGASYPAEPHLLLEKINEFYSAPNGSGFPGKKEHPSGDLKAILVPHIDLRVGGACYTHAYRQLWENSDVERYIILGVAHYGNGQFFTSTLKDFETPLGKVKTDKAFLADFHQNAGVDFSLGEWAHRTEHSIEFQLPFLQHQKNDVEIVPLLCGSIEPYLEKYPSLKSANKINRMIDALGETLRASPKKTMLILSVDLAHMGPKFGDPFKITPEKSQQIHEADHKLFEVLSQMDADAFEALMRADLVERKVDACAAVYTLLRLMKKGKGTLCRYDQNFQPDTQSLVSYGSMAFWKK